MFNLIFSSDRHNKSDLDNHKNAESVKDGLNSLNLTWRNGEGVFEGREERSFIVCGLTYKQLTALTSNVVKQFNQDCVLVVCHWNGACALATGALDSVEEPVNWVGHITMSQDQPEDDYTYDPVNRVYYTIY